MQHVEESQPAASENEKAITCSCFEVGDVSVNPRSGV